MSEQSASEWDRIVAALHDWQNIRRAVDAYAALDKAADESWLPRLHDLLANGRNFFVREAAAYPIARLEGLRALPRLLHAVELGEQEGHDNDGLTNLIDGLVQVNPEEAAPILRQMLQHGSNGERLHATCLWGFGAKALEPEPIMELVNDPDPRIRSAAVGSLGSFKTREAVFAILLQALEDPDDGVKCSAAIELGYSRDQRAVAPLRKLLSGSPESVRRVVRYALQQLKKAK